MTRRWQAFTDGLIAFGGYVAILLGAVLTFAGICALAGLWAKLAWVSLRFGWRLL